MADEQYTPPVLLMEMHPDEPRTSEAVGERIGSNPFLRHAAERAELVVATWPQGADEMPFLLIYKHRHGTKGGGHCKVFRASRVVEGDEVEMPARAAELAALARWRRLAAVQGMGEVPWSLLPEQMREALIAASRLDLQAALPAFGKEMRDEILMEAEERMEGYKFSAELAAEEARADQAGAEADAATAELVAVVAGVVAASCVAAMVRMWRRG